MPYIRLFGYPASRILYAQHRPKTNIWQNNASCYVSSSLEDIWTQIKDQVIRIQLPDIQRKKIISGPIKPLSLLSL